MCASAAAQTPGFALLIRVRRQELEINRCRRDFRRLFRGPLQHHLRLLDRTTVGNPLHGQ